MSRCLALYESPKPATTLTLTLTVSGVLETYDSATDLTNTIAFAEVTETRTLTRIPFVPREWYSGGAFPGEGEFHLTTQCCCFRCRFHLIGHLAEGIYLAAPEGELPWESTWTGPLAPDAETGTDPLRFRVLDGWLRDVAPGEDGYTAQITGLRKMFCRSSGESGRRGQAAALAADDTFRRPTGFTAPPLDWSYTDPAGTTTGTAYVPGGLDVLTLPGPMNLDPDYPGVEMASCENTQSVAAEILYNGSETLGTVTSRVIDFSLAMTLDLS